jgi:hypothetical protein
MRNWCSNLHALFRDTKVVKPPFYSIGPKMMLGRVSEHFAYLRHVKDGKLVLKPTCTISRYQSCEASVLLYWTQNYIWQSFEALRKPSARKRLKTHVSGLSALFQCTKVAKHPFYSIRHKMMFGGVSKHIANLR